MQKKAGRAAEPAKLDPAILFKGLAGRRGLIAAVSGGPDSTALMLLIAEWRERPPVIVATVDHGLRAGSAAEADLVAHNARRLGLECRVLTAPEPFVGGNLQDWARRVRYACLARAAREAEFDAIVTAHHREDQAETFLIRLARGSGVYGLAAMSETGGFDGVGVIRPLLDVARAELLKIAAESGLPLADDPSNSDPRFDRVRLRALAPALAPQGLTAERLAATAFRLRRAAEALDHYVRQFLQAFQADRFGVVGGPAAAFAGVPEETALRALALVLKAAGGADHTPPLQGVEALLAAIVATDAPQGFRRTLHGAVISLTDGRFLAQREWGRDGLETASAAPGATLLWDRRFRVGIPQVAGELAVGPLGASGRRLRAEDADRPALRAMPGLFQNGALVAVPGSVLPADDGPAFQNLSVTCVVGKEIGLAAGGGYHSARF
jgi:tRNA(Ile)-lysidine synthase